MPAVLGTSGRTSPFSPGTAFPFRVSVLVRMIVFRGRRSSLRSGSLPLGFSKKLLQYLDASAQAQKHLSQAKLLQFEFPKFDLASRQFRFQDVQPGLKLFSHGLCSFTQVEFFDSSQKGGVRSRGGHSGK
jgi:hypothetical protein